MWLKYKANTYGEQNQYFRILAGFPIIELDQISLNCYALMASKLHAIYRFCDVVIYKQNVSKLLCVKSWIRKHDSQLRV